MEHRCVEPGRRRAARRRAPSGGGVGDLRLRLSDGGAALMDETDPYPGPPPKGGDDMLAALRGMEQTVLTSGEHSDTEGIVLRYGIFYGPGVPHDELFTRLAKWWALPAMTGNGIAVVGAHRRRREGDRRRARQGPRRADVQHRRRPTAVVRRLCRASCPRSCIGLGRCRFRIGWWAWSRPIRQRRSERRGCRCPTPRRRPNSAGRLFPGEVRRAASRTSR